MKHNDAIRETEYLIGKYIFWLLEKSNHIKHEQFLALRDALLDKYHPIIGELERGADFDC